MKKDGNRTKQNEKLAWMPLFENPKQYADRKIDMLRHHMYINPTEAEIEHLYELKTKTDIDNAVHSIIDRHWKDAWEKL